MIDDFAIIIGFKLLNCFYCYNCSFSSAKLLIIFGKYEKNDEKVTKNGIILAYFKINE